MSRKSSAWPSGCSREGYIRSCVEYLLKDTPQRRAELLATLGPEWCRDFDAEIKRRSEKSGAVS